MNRPICPLSLRERAGACPVPRYGGEGDSSRFVYGIVKDHEVGVRYVLPVRNCLVWLLAAYLEPVRVYPYFRRPGLKPAPKCQGSHRSYHSF